MKRPRFRLTRAADRALDEIFRRGVAEFGLRQAQDYLLGLHEAFGMLAQIPAAGRVFHEFRRHEHGGHIIFYLPDGDAITIVDVVNTHRDLEAWRSTADGHCVLARRHPDPRAKHKRTAFMRLATIAAAMAASGCVSVS